MKIVFMGTPQAAVPSLEKLLSDGHEIIAVWTQPDKPAGRGNKLRASPVKEFALANDLKVYQPAKIKTRESLELFRSHQADVAVVVAYGRILPESFLNSFPKGAINLHFSLLPEYRGAAPVNWAIAGGETQSGVTTMKMDVGLDTGDVLQQLETEISDGETAIELMSRLSISGADLLSQTLLKYDELIPKPQDDAKATFAPIMQKSDGLIDWNLKASEINRRIRGFQPFPTSFTVFQNKKLTIWKAGKMENGKWKMENAGTIVEINKDDFVVACGHQTFLKILELQVEGKKRMAVRDFLNGSKIEIGEKLG
ncbi:MAG: methionyl-tRNA formyltransferase [Pyrinomonadaceae bacterium]